MDTKQQQRGNGITTCLLCGDGKKRPKRGLCVKHYTRFYNALRRLPKEMQKAWQEQLIAEGKLMESAQGRDAEQEPDEFAQSAETFLADHPVSRSVDTIIGHQAGETPQQTAADPPKKYKRYPKS